MKLFKPPTALVLYSDLSPDECARRLRDAMDVEERSAFSFSGYRGSKPFVGEVDGRHFRVLERTYARNSFPPVLTGEFRSRGRGTEIQGAFDLELMSKIAICLISWFVAVAMVPAVYYSFAGHSENRFMAIAFAAVFFPLAFLSPRIIREIGASQEREIADFLWTTLEAGDDASAFGGGRGL